MRETFFLVAVFIGHILSAQNLVVNPSFECGPEICHFTEEARWFNDDNDVCSWTCPTVGTSDVFSTSLSGKGCEQLMPTTDPFREGTQLPRTGNRFMGIINALTKFGPTLPVKHEYLQGELTEPLIMGEYYLASMYVSLAEGPQWASNNLGIYFSDTKIIDYNNDSFLPRIPQVNASEVILDTKKWVRICGTFKATSSAKYLLIGNFFDEASTKHVVKTGTWSPNNPKNFWAYYYIDDVSVEKISGLTLPLPLNSVNPICEKQSAKLVATGEYDNISWAAYPDTTKILGASSILSVTPKSTTKYLGVAKACGITYKDTVTVRVNPLPVVNLGADSTLCQGTLRVLNVRPGYASYSWQDSSQNKSFNVTRSGKYSVKVKTKYGCSTSDNILLTFINAPKVNLGADTLECNHLKPLQAYGNKKAYFNWSTGSIDSVIIPQSSGKYWVTIRNQCGVATDTIRIYSMSDAFIPNVVTDNDDRLNSKFKITEVGDATFLLKIFDRWGITIFTDNRYHNSWPNDQGLPTGTYYYLLSYPGCPDKKGWIELIR